MGAALFTADQYEIAVADQPVTLNLGPFPSHEAEPLATAIAAIPPWSIYGYPAAAIASYLKGSEPEGRRYLMQVDGLSAGAVGLQPNWLRGPYLRFLAILPPFQGRGLGAAILRWIEDEARNAGQRNVWVVASQINTDAIRFYERHGFAQAAHLDDLAYDDRVEILMRKRLAQSA